jgi:YgiT-type zinc finger domain-containing protein
VVCAVGMNCILCKSNLVKGNINHIVDFDGHIIIIKGVSANVCKQCGEYYIENDIALKLEKMIEIAKKNKAEILVVNYSEMAA